MGTHPIFESDFDCLTEEMKLTRNGIFNVVYFAALFQIFKV